MRAVWLTSLLLLLLPALAGAGELRVHACQYPDGSVAPFVATNLSEADGYGWGDRSSAVPNSSCANGGIMRVSNPGLDLNLNEWIFRIPEGTRIQSFTIARNLQGHSAANSSSLYYLIANDRPSSESQFNPVAGTFTPQGEVFQACKSPGVTVGSYPDCGQLSGTYTFSPLNPAGSQFLHVVEWCNRIDSPGASCADSHTVVDRVSATLSDPQAPAGSLSGDGAQSLQGKNLGQRQFVVQASDAESGVLSAELRVDGVTVTGPSPLSNATAECADKYSGVGGDGYDYNLPRPCPASGSVSLLYDPAGLSPGAHAVQVIVRDATGNPTVLGDQVGAPQTYSWTVVGPACSDGQDNDSDGLTDTADPGCHSDNSANNPDSYQPTRDDETDARFPLCTRVRVRFDPGRYERRYTRTSASGRSATTYARPARRYAGKPRPRIRIRGQLSGPANCIAYMHIANSRRVISKRSNGSFIEFYFEGLPSGRVRFQARDNAVTLRAYRR